MQQKQPAGQEDFTISLSNHTPKLARCGGTTVHDYA